MQIMCIVMKTSEIGGIVVNNPIGVFHTGENALLFVKKCKEYNTTKPRPPNERTPENLRAFENASEDWDMNHPVRAFSMIVRLSESEQYCIKSIYVGD